jgi:hypothetical protein
MYWNNLIVKVDLETNMLELAYRNQGISKKIFF